MTKKKRHRFAGCRGALQSLPLAACGFLFATQPVLANPQGGVVSAGQANISSAGDTLTIHQQSDRAVVDWQGFDIAPHEHTQFIQPSSSSLTLNRVHSSQASYINGRLSANGNVIISNQNGIIFGSQAQVDVNGLVATTADIENDRFMHDRVPVFNKPGHPDAAVINHGGITAKDAGLVGLVAPRVENSGVIQARAGRVHLASGDMATLDFYGDGLLEIGVSDRMQRQLVKNTGRIEADGGTIALTAAEGRQVVDSLVEAKGTLRAHHAAGKQGKILVAGDARKTDVMVDGVLDVSGAELLALGGAIHVRGARIALLSQTYLDASGMAGGGEILVGGDYKGGDYRGNLDASQITGAAWGNTAGGYSAVNGTAVGEFFADYYARNPTLNSLRVYVDAAASADASAAAGHGGRVIYWSDNGTAYYGQTDVSASGAVGDGGFIEVSGRDWLGFAGLVNNASAHGETGTTLLDPADITISNAAGSAISASTPFQSTGAGASNLNITTLQGALNGASNITISSAAGKGGNGDITFAGPLSWNSVRSLTVTASRNITVNNTITNAGTGSITLNANVAATGDIAINDNISTGGSITALARRNLTLAAGKTLTTGTAGALSLRAANGSTAGTGNLSILGNMAVGAGGLTLSSGVNGSRPSLTLGGTNLVRLGASFGSTINIQGFQDLTIDRDINGTSAATYRSMRDLTLNASRTVTASILTMYAANAVVGGTGNLNINGNLVANLVTLTSGINVTRPSITFNSTNLNSINPTFSNFDIRGFQDITFDRDITYATLFSSSSVRDFTLSAGRTLTGVGTSAISISAANGSALGTGNINFLGNLSLGSGSITMTSGVNGTRPDLVIDNARFASSTVNPFGSISIQGFRHVTIDRDLSSTGPSGIAIGAYGDLTLQSGRTVTSASNAGTTLQAGTASNAGNLYLNGVVSSGTGQLNLTSGATANGARPSLTINSSNVIRQGASFGNTSITGFNDITIDRDMNSSAGMTITAMRDLNILSGRTIAGTSVSLGAANGSAAGTGRLIMDGIISMVSGNLSLISGINGTRPSLTLDGTNLLRSGASFGTVTLQGFNALTIDRLLNASSTMTFGTNTQIILKNDISGTGTLTIPNALVIGEGQSPTITAPIISISGTINGTAGGVGENLTLTSTATNLTTLSGVVGGLVPLGNLTLIGDNATISNTLNGTGTLTFRPVTAGRAVNLGTAAADNSLAAGLNLSNNEVARIANGWSSLVFGSLTAGTLTNTRASWLDPVSFISGVDVINSIATTTSSSIFARAVRDVIINQNIATTSTASDAITLVAGRNLVNNRGATGVSTGTGGRWLIYSTNPTGSTGEDALSNAFNRYSCTYGASCPSLGSGNGLLYSYTPTLSIDITDPAYHYGDAVGTPTAYTINPAGYLNALDSAEGSSSGTATFQTTYAQGNNAGTSYSISNNGSALVSNLGYGFTFGTTNGTVATRAITVRANNQTQTYGFGGLGTTAFNISSGNLYGTDAIGSVALSTNATTSGAGEYIYSATPWSLSAASAVFSSGNAANYAVSYADAPVGLTINRRALSLATVTGSGKIYDGTTSATLTGSTFDAAMSGDDLSLSGLAGEFASENAGAQNFILSAGTLGGADANNYSFTLGTPTGSAAITPAVLTVAAQNATRQAGQANPTFTASYSGFKGVDTASVISGLTFSTPATLASAAGSYDIIPAGANATNYTFSFVNGVLTVTAAPNSSSNTQAQIADNIIYGWRLATDGISGRDDFARPSLFERSPATYRQPSDSDEPSHQSMRDSRHNLCADGRQGFC